MKKSNLLILALAAPLMLAACGDNGKTPSYAGLDAALTKTYSFFSVAVHSSKGDLSLLDTYAYTLDGESYSIEFEKQQYNVVSLDSIGSRIKVESGTDEVESSKVSFAKFAVDASKYSNIVYDEEAGKLEASVVAPSTFVNETSATEMSIKIRFGVSLTSIELSYKVGEYSVTAEYTDFME